MDISNFLPNLSSPLSAIPAVFLGGVLTSLTPCVYPMIPITAAIVGGTSVGEDAAGATRPPRWRPAILTLTYVFGLALVYSALGLFAGLSGTLFGTVSTNPWLYFAMANLLLVGAVVAGKFMDKNNWDAFAGFLIVELGPVIGRQMWHAILIQKAWARAERPASMVITDPLV